VGLAAVVTQIGNTDWSTSRLLTLQRHLLTPEPTRRTMVGIVRYIRNIQRSGLRQWWRNMQYIGDAKYGALQGTDQSVSQSLSSVVPRATFNSFSYPVRFGNRYFENLDPEDEVPGQQTTHYCPSVPVLTIPFIPSRPPPMGRLRSGMVT